MCAPGGAHIFIFKNKLAGIEKGCPLCFGALTGSLVEGPNLEVRQIGLKCQAKIHKSHEAVAVQHQILKLQISMAHAVLVAVSDGFHLRGCSAGVRFSLPCYRKNSIVGFFLKLQDKP